MKLQTVQEQKDYWISINGQDPESTWSDIFRRNKSYNKMLMTGGNPETMAEIGKKIAEAQEESVTLFQLHKGRVNNVLEKFDFDIGSE